MAIRAAGMFGRIPVSRYGLTAARPRAARASTCDSSVAIPPTPPTITPIRSGSMSRPTSMPASARASAAASRARTTIRSSTRVSGPDATVRGSMSGSRPATSSDSLTGWPSGGRVSPDRPVISASKVSSTPRPTGVNRPIPVINAVTSWPR
ncbi:hypothetical protein ONO86_04531 [Micromonospora noduli]|nr:hypothetical protein ONO86_04531 [Micromonospora noduli]